MDDLNNQHRDKGELFVGPPTEKCKLINDMVDRWVDETEGEDGSDNIEAEETAFRYGLTQTFIFKKHGEQIKINDWPYWLRLETWTPEQAACLLYEIDKTRLPKDKPEVDAVIHLHEDIEKLYIFARGKGDMSPYDWKMFALKHGFFVPYKILNIQRPVLDIEESAQVSEIDQAKPIESELKAEAIEDGGLDSKENTNDIAASALLKLPSRQDDWVDVISDMATAFYAEFGKLPNESQAWGRLCTAPPNGYEIKIGKDKGEGCLEMPGVKPLGKRAFGERWKKYTATSSE